MGMYTGLRFKAVIKEEYCPMIERMTEEGLEWSDLASIYPEIKELNSFAHYSRADFIPYGSLAYMPDEWDGDRDFEFKFEEKVWQFQCSLKNYDETIQEFLDVIASLIVEKVIHIEYLYEEWDCGILFDFNENGEIVKTDGKVIYHEEEEVYGWY